MALIIHMHSFFFVSSTFFGEFVCALLFSYSFRPAEWWWWWPQTKPQQCNTKIFRAFTNNLCKYRQFRLQFCLLFDLHFILLQCSVQNTGLMSVCNNNFGCLLLLEPESIKVQSLKLSTYKTKKMSLTFIAV